MNFPKKNIQWNRPSWLLPSCLYKTREASESTSQDA
jgi:hypothetical protein